MSKQERHPKHAPGSRAPAETASRRHRRVFRLVALSLPVLGLILFEGILRLAGYGYDPRYFHQRTVRGESVWVENRDFTRRFFPPGLERAPQPLMLPVKKDPGTTRIFVFGESAAMGDPEPAYGFSRFLGVLLRERHPDRRFEIANLATTAISSHVVREIAREAAARDGDIWIVYMGNNEVVGPYGAGTIFSGRAPGRVAIRAGLAVRATRVGQLLEDVRRSVFPLRRTPRQWEGMEMFLEQQVRRDDPAMETVYAHFETNLRDIVDFGLRSGARVLVSTVAVNLKDCSPFASLPGRAWPASQARAWTNAVEEGLARMATNDFAGALRRFEAASRVDDDYADVHFRKAVCQLELGDTTAARDAFERARDLDTLRFRADGTINGIIRHIRSDRDDERVAVLDAAAVIDAASPGHLAGHEFLFEHVHFNPEGNLRLARAMADRLEPWLEGTPPAADSDAPLPDEICLERLALTDWDRLRILEEMVKRLRQPPFNHQWRHRERERRLESAITALRARWPTEGRARAAEMYRGAVARSPDDFMLRRQHAAFLEETGDLAAAAEAWRGTLDLRPMSHEACYRLANTLDKLGRSGEAVAWFEKALALEPDLSEAQNGLALALANLQRAGEARRLLEKLVERRPDFVEARVNLGQLWSQEGRDDLAERQYAEALARQSNSVAAHLNWGRLLGRRGAWERAEAHYREALRVDPDNAMAWFNLGNALSAQKSPQALEAYERAVAGDAALAPARYNYGLALAEEGRTAEAFAQFEELVRQQPAMAEARFNYGVALAKMERYEEAAREFEETLKLDPRHGQARKFLELARSRAGQP